MKLKKASTMRSSECDPCTISDLADLNPTVALSQLTVDSEVSFIPMSDVTETGRWDIRQTRRLLEVRKGYTAFQENDVLFAKITPCMENGKGCHAVDLVNGVGFGSTEFHVLRAKADSDARFIYHLTQFKDLRLRAAAKMVGSAGQQRVPSSFFSEYQVIKPEREDQVLIASVLSCIDLSIEQTEIVIAKHQRIKAGLMQDFLTNGIDEHGNVRSEMTHEFKESRLGRIPKDWDVQPLSQIADLQVGYAFKSDSFSEGGLRLLRGENVGFGKPDWSDTRYLPERLAEGFSDYILREGDLVIGMDRTFTKSGVKVSKLGNQDVPSLLVQRVGRFQASGCDASFLTLLVSQNEYLFALRNQEKGMDIPHLSKTEILSPLVRVPPETEQRRIAERGAIVSKFIKSLYHDLEKLMSLKAGLMSDLLTGRIPVEPLRADFAEAGVAI